MICATKNSATTQDIAEFWENANYNSDNDWFDRNMRENPAYSAFVARMLDESEIAKNAGQITPHNEVVRKISWKLENGIL